jgi:DNA-binding MarR family transcriptional regulator
MHTKNRELFALTNEHKAILQQFLRHNTESLSTADLHGFTNIEPIKISAIIADLVAHDIVRKTNADAHEDKWLYQLSEEGLKFSITNT